MSTLIDTLVELVDTPSVTGAEGRLCTAIASRLMPVWDRTGVDRIGNSLVVGERTGRPLIALYGHIDTVPEQGNGTARIEDGKVFGLGTSDMKAGVAVMIHLLEDPEIRSGPYDVVGVFYDKEEGPADENGLEDVLRSADWLLDAELSVVMEPTANALELGCNGAMNATVGFSGAPSHSARPWLGENAVTKAGAWLAELHDRDPELFEVAGLEFREVFTVTTAHGGIARNIVPGRFEVNLNYRFPPVFDLEQAEARLRAVTDAADDVTIVDRAPAGAIDADNPHVTRLLAVSGAERAGKQGWTDVARLTSKGVPAVNFGPGIPAMAHQPGEYVEIATVEGSYAAMRRFLLS